MKMTFFISIILGLACSCNGDKRQRQPAQTQVDDLSLEVFGMTTEEMTSAFETRSQKIRECDQVALNDGYADISRSMVSASDIFKDHRASSMDRSLEEGFHKVTLNRIATLDTCLERVCPSVPENLLYLHQRCKVKN